MEVTHSDRITVAVVAPGPDPRSCGRGRKAAPVADSRSSASNGSLVQFDGAGPCCKQLEVR